MRIEGLTWFSIGVMGHRRITAHQFTTLIAAAFLVLVSAFVAHSQSQRAPGPASTVRGTVRDSHGIPIEGVSVHLEFEGSRSPLTVISDAKGEYHCAAPAARVYTLRAEKAGYAGASVGPFALLNRQVKVIDFTLAAGPIGEASRPAAATPEFYDEPQFTVAGVTDAMSHGGHGSDTVSRTTESLAREVAVLDKNSNPAPASTANLVKSLRNEAGREPGSFEANQKLGILLARADKPAEAIPYLERAHHIRGDDYESAKELARAYVELGRDNEAETILHSLLANQDKAELHHLLGDIEEKQKHPLEAVREYQRAAELDPSEPNLFDWGAELLTHRALTPAVQVFTKGNRLFPRSARMLVGLGVAWYASGSPDAAVKYVCQASDLDPADPNPYLVLGKIEIGQSAGLPEVVHHLERFARLHPENAQANYYYAVSLWKQGRASEQPEISKLVESLLEKAIQLDPRMASSFLQLGVLYDDRGELPKAIELYQNAVRVDPQLGEAHYRLAHAYRRTGDKTKADEELASYREISQHAEQQAEREAREIPRFVYTLRDPKPQAQSQ